jgi:NADPH:quinone reductase-like Zn-dependent oxidoreductase
MEEVPQPRIRPRDVLVKVLASTINIDDIHVSEGTFYGGIPIGRRPRPARPVIPGSDLAGIVVAVGSRVRSFQTGDAVFGLQTPFRASGSWAEFCAVDERWIARKPERVSFEIAAASAVSGLVALSAMKALRLRPGLRTVIVGASGGIGAMAVQLASRSGAEVIGVCGSKNAERARSLGCAQVLDYNRGPWDQTLRDQGRAPVDRVLDVVGGRDTEQMGRSVLRRDGIFVTVVGPERFIGDRALGWSRILGIFAHIGYRTLSSFVRGPRYILTGPGLGGGKALAEVAAALCAGMVPPVDSTVPFELQPMQEALRRAAAHQNRGRIAIHISR